MTTVMRGHRSANNLGRTVLLIVLDRDHVVHWTHAAGRDRGAYAHTLGRDVDLPVRGASAAIGHRRRRGRGRDATTARADVPVRAVGVGGAGREPRPPALACTP